MAVQSHVQQEIAQREDFPLNSISRVLVFRKLRSPLKLEDRIGILSADFGRFSDHFEDLDPNIFLFTVIPSTAEMSRRAVVLRQTSSDRRHPLLSTKSYSRSARFAEVAGGTAAECAAIFCCCPCGLVNFLVLAIYKIPAGLWRRALRKKRRKRLIRKGLLQPRRQQCSCGSGESEIQIHPVDGANQSEIKLPKSDESEKAAAELEKEMWTRFYSTGFWRSLSQREPPLPISIVSVNPIQVN